MRKRTGSDVRKLPVFDHGAKIGNLYRRAASPWPTSVQQEAHQELRRYADQGRILQRYNNQGGNRMARDRDFIPMTRSGYCALPSTGKNSHLSCRLDSCTCDCHTTRTFAGQGIVFAVIDNREEMDSEVTTIDIVAGAIDEALDNGYEDSEQIARYLTTSAFQHLPNKRVQFNSVLKAGDAVGAQITRKLYNSYHELMQMAEDATDPDDQAWFQAEARGFAEAIQVVMSPFSVEDHNDPRVVDWDEMTTLTDLFEEEQQALQDANKEEYL